MMYNILKYSIYLLIIIIIFFTGCIAPPKTNIPDEEEYEDIGIPDSTGLFSFITFEDSKLSNGDLIFKYAFKEQQKYMYSKSSEYVYLYWLKNKKLNLKNRTKCNIFAINTLFKAGFLCPKENARTVDLMNEKLFNDVLPIADVSKPSELVKGDLIIWNGHVIIYDTIATVNKDLYAKAIWAGTRKNDNGKNIINNVIYGKYPLSGNFIVRRPIKRKM
jgi:hypothetical protein